MSRSSSPSHAFDPDRPLPAPPEPWAASTMPVLRGAPPYLMTEMIAAEPALAARILSREASADSASSRLALEVRRALERRSPIVVTGCGTSEHGALAFAEIVRGAMLEAGLEATPGSPTAVQALEASLAPQSSGLLVAVSHEGGTPATIAALEAVGSSGTVTALLTAAAGSPAAALADIVVATGELDQSWCHTVGYLSPILVAAAVSAHLAGRLPAAEAARMLVAAGASDANAAAAEAIAARLAHARAILVVGSGVDRVAARELVLKIEEGAGIPTAMRDLETFLHGHLAATGAEIGLVLVATDPAHVGARIERARQVLAAAVAVGIAPAAILSPAAAAALPRELTQAGRLVTGEPGAAPESTAEGATEGAAGGSAALGAAEGALLASAPALQLLAERLARAAGRNPDAIGRDDERYRRAAEIADEPAERARPAV